MEATASMYDEPLAQAEGPAVARAVESRQREFRAGRACARAALRELGLDAAAVPVGERRAPVWPPGIVGAITHCRGYCAAAAARADDVGSVGLDAEERRRVSERLARSICTAPELERLHALGDVPEWATLAFSAKEAGYKALAPLCGRFIGFSEAEVDVDPAAPEVRIRMVDGPLAGIAFGARWTAAGALVAVGVTLSREQADDVRARVR